MGWIGGVIKWVFRIGRGYVKCDLMQSVMIVRVTDVLPASHVYTIASCIDLQETG